MKHKCAVHFLQLTQDVPLQLDRLHLSILTDHVGQWSMPSRRTSSQVVGAVDRRLDAVSSVCDVSPEGRSLFLRIFVPSRHSACATCALNSCKRMGLSERAVLCMPYNKNCLLYSSHSGLYYGNVNKMEKDSMIPFLGFKSGTIQTDERIQQVHSTHIFIIYGNNVGARNLLISE